MSLISPGGRSGTPKTLSFYCTGAVFWHMGPPGAPTRRPRNPKGPQRRPHYAAQVQCFSTWIPRRPQRDPQDALILLHRCSVLAHGPPRGPQGPPRGLTRRPHSVAQVQCFGTWTPKVPPRRPQGTPKCCTGAVLGTPKCCTGAVFWHMGPQGALKDPSGGSQGALILLHRCSVLAHGAFKGTQGPPKGHQRGPQ